MDKNRYDKIEEIEKFNPFHDAAGKFSNKHGFSSYSANPNTRAGAMAIARSAAAGHMNTKNVHREAQSTGTTIRQNANWLGRGKQATPGQQGSTTLNRRIEPKSGLSGASAAGASWQQQNQAQGRTTGNNKAPQKATNAATKPAAAQATKPQAAAQKPAQQAQQQPQQANAQFSTTSLNAQVKAVKLTSSDRMAIQPRDGYGNSTTATKKAARDNYQAHVVGKDISKTADIRKVSGSADPIDKMVRLQGWDKPPTVTNDLETFQKAAKASGYMLIRTVHGNGSSGQTGLDVCRDTMTNGRASLGGTGAKMYGSGLYMVGADLKGKTGRTLGRQVQTSQRSSAGYGDTQMMSTIHPSAKIATPRQATSLKTSFSNLSTKERSRFGNDFGAYIASKGYDGARWHDDSDPYVTVYNKSALIFYGGVSDV